MERCKREAARVEQIQHSKRLKQRGLWQRDRWVWKPAGQEMRNRFWKGSAHKQGQNLYKILAAIEGREI